MGESGLSRSTVVSSSYVSSIAGTGEGDGDRRAARVNCRHARISWTSCGSVILLAGLGVKIFLRMLFKSSVMGSIDFKNDGSRKYARYVESEQQASFHGFRPQVRFTRITPRLQMSLGAQK